MPLIIIEGCDATGKTSLINRLSKELNLPTVKSYRPSTREDIRRFTFWVSAAPRTPISDRAPFISDLVYGPVIRGSTPASIELAQELTTSAFLVHCAPPWTTVQNTIDNEPQMDGVKDNLREIYDAYESLMQILEPQFIFDYTKPRAYNALVTQLLHYLERVKQ